MKYPGKPHALVIFFYTGVFMIMYQDFCFPVDKLLI